MERWDNKLLDKKYIYLQDEGDKYWIELDGENYAVRQISRDTCGRYHLSCFEDCLAEGVFEEKCIEKIISKNEFQELWDSCLARFSKQWKSVKTKYKIGSNVLGRVEYYYPQGIILKGTDFTALYRGKNNYRLHEEVSVRIVKYDDDNMWFVVE